MAEERTPGNGVARDVAAAEVVDARLGSTEGEKKLPAKNINNAF